MAQTLTRLAPSIQSSSPQSTQLKESMKSYFSNPAVAIGNQRMLTTKMMQDPIRKTDQPNYSSSPKNVIVKTSKYLFKNVAPEQPKKIPKSDSNMTKDTNITA